MHLGRSFHSTEPLYLKLFLPYAVVLNDGALTYIFRKLCPVFLDRFDHFIQVRWALLAQYFIHLQCYLSHSIELEGN